MTQKLDHVIVIDTHCTCWKEEPPEGESSEIIEIGVCTVDLDTLAIGERDTILVRPSRSKVSEHCTETTTLTQKQVDSGITFKEACLCLERRHNSGDRIWASYGDVHRNRFERQCQLEGIPYPFGGSHMNVMNLFALMHGIPRELNLPEAMEFIDKPISDGPRGAAESVGHITTLLGIVLSAKREP